MSRISGLADALDWSRPPSPHLLAVDSLQRWIVSLAYYRASIGKRLAELSSGAEGDLYRLLSTRPERALVGIRAEHVWLLATGEACDSPAAWPELTECQLFPDLRYVTAPEPAWTTAALRAIDNGIGSGEPSRIADAVSTGTVTHAVSSGLSLLEKVWSAEVSACRCLLTEIVVVERSGFFSSSIPATFGAVYIGGSAVPTATDALLLVVHEVSHHMLVVESARGVLLRNPAQLALSPFRAEPRPMDTVLHATFVASRLTECLQRIKNHRVATENAERQLTRYASARDAGLETLEREAVLTSRGVMLLRWMQSQRSENGQERKPDDL